MFRLIRRVCHKSTMPIPTVSCCRDQLRFAHNTEMHEFITNNHPWCNTFCKEYCMKMAVDSCIEESREFCKQNCKTECYHVGRVPSKVPVL
jgi:hypothetical protein